MTLDPARVAGAKLRAEELLREAEFLERRARVARNRAALLARTWGFEFAGNKP